MVPADLEGQRLVDVCWAHLGVVARRAVGPLIAAGELTVDNDPAKIAQPVATGQRLRVTADGLARLDAERLLSPPSPEPLDVVHEDTEVLVADKPSGQHVHPMGPHREDSLLGRVLWHVGARPGHPWTTCAPAPAHRLDRPTSGLVAFTKTAEAGARFAGLMERHEVERTYRARVHGGPAADHGLIDVPLARDPQNWRRQAAVPEAAGGQPARSRWTVIDRDGDTSLLELTLETGRTHQLRAHLAHLGHPIVGDTIYGADPTGPPPDPAVGETIALRAVTLRWPTPDGGERRVVAPSPPSSRP